MSDPVHGAVEALMRGSYGRLVAWFTGRTGDLAAAEDAVAEALASALATWPVRGVPDAPEAWVRTSARNALLDAARRRAVRDAAAPGIWRVTPCADELAGPPAVPDERLALMFVCCHPSIDPRVHAPLVLQAVLGLSAERIASAFLVSPATLGQRLSRAKTKIRTARVPFAVPDRSELAGRLDGVLSAIYAAYGTSASSGRPDLHAEAVRLARVVADLLPAEPEALGLLALLLHGEARAPARERDGVLVPLAEQDTALWDRALAGQAEALLVRAARAGRPGRFQLEAVISGVHTLGGLTGETNWAAVCATYDALLALAPSLGAAVGAAAAYGELSGPQVGLARLAALPPSARGYQPYWATRAHLEARSGLPAGASYERALGLTQDEAVRRLLRRLSAAASQPEQAEDR